MPEANFRGSTEVEWVENRCECRLDVVPEDGLVGCVVGGGASIGAWAMGQQRLKDPMETEIRLRSLTPKEVYAIKSFEKYSDGRKMTKESFECAMKALGITDVKVVNSFFECFDQAHDGKISYREFISAVTLLHHKGECPKEKLKFIFDALDSNGTGVVDSDEMNSTLYSLLVARENLIHSDKAKNVLYTNSSERTTTQATGMASFDLMGMDPYMEVDYISQRQFEIYHEFPFLQGYEINDCIKKLAGRYTRNIFEFADVNKDGIITFQEFENWIKKSDKQTEFLLGIFDEFHFDNTNHKAIITDEK
eukprot:CAMPEP_0197518150 /NCGR_PEP_ID=MMETSP1318-20131121/3274_1 /TAXON_ID=552666 /ORGANISM="Partenskyella glossopodia, Strain RCC365" /LENGTH=306 /DNA_ID=CAMNT_0043068259 /DNA_START=147 /DNA_END=1068 /DNA_ORIENTATION=-